MVSQIYISQLKDEIFDYNIKNPNGDHQYAPKPISSSVDIHNLYRDIVRKVLDHDENTKQTDWGTFVIKLTKTELINFLSRYKRVHIKEWPDSMDVNTLLNCVNELTDGEYLLVAQEIC